MATLKVNGTSYLVMSNKVTTPSIIIQGVGYIPLFQSSSNTIDYLRYRYTLGNLRVGNYRAATSRTFINHNPSVSISAVDGASGAGNLSVPMHTEVKLQAYGADEDGDTLTYKWNTGATTSSISVVNDNVHPTDGAIGNLQKKSYYCTVADPHGGSARSNTITISWYNSAPLVEITAYHYDKDGKFIESSTDSITAGTNETVSVVARVDDYEGDQWSGEWYASGLPSAAASWFSQKDRGGQYSGMIGRDQSGTIYCRVTDMWGATNRSNTIKITWKSTKWVYKGRIVHIPGYKKDEYSWAPGEIYAETDMVKDTPTQYQGSDAMLYPGTLVNKETGLYYDAKRRVAVEDTDDKQLTVYLMTFLGEETIDTGGDTHSGTVDTHKKVKKFQLIKTDVHTFSKSTQEFETDA